MNNEYNTINYNNKRTIDNEIRNKTEFSSKKYFISSKYIWVIDKSN